MPDSNPPADSIHSPQQRELVTGRPNLGKPLEGGPDNRRQAGVSTFTTGSNWPRHGLFVTGTDTNVGKTFVGAIIVRSLTREGYRVGVYKPVASGCEVVEGELLSADASALWEAAGRPADLGQVCPQRFAAPLAPNLAAAAEGSSVDSQRLRTGLAAWTDQSDLVVVEGAGGLYSPLSEQDFVIDLAREMGYPLVIVAANRLGTINATLQTVLAARAAGLTVAGIVLNTVEHLPADPSLSSNAAELDIRLKQLGWAVPLLGTVAYGAGQIDRFPPGEAAPASWADLSQIATAETPAAEASDRKS